MWLLVAALLVQQQPVQPQKDTARAVAVDSMHAARADSADRKRQHNNSIRLTPKPRTTLASDTGGAYLDAAARELVMRARERRSTLNAEVRSYAVTAKERFSIGVKALRRDRLAFSQDQVANIQWAAGQPTRIEVVGLRQAAPIAVRGFMAPHDLSGAKILAFDPMDDRLQLGMASDDHDSTFVRHPLGTGSEAYYRFASGDTTTVRLPDGRTLRLLELRVIPRKDDVHLLRGSLWLDGASLGVVRGVFRLAADYDMQMDYALDGDTKDVPMIGLLQPIRASLKFLTIEYGLVNFRWWMPRLMAVEGSVQLGAAATFPARYERVYSGYAVTGDTVATRIAAAPSVNRGSSRCQNKPDRSTVCDCKDGNCQRYEIHAATDSAGLIASAELPPPPAGAYDEPLFTESQLEDLGRKLESIPDQPWKASPPRLNWGLGRSGLVRFNRVEGLSLGARADWDFGKLTADVTGRLGVAPAPKDSSPALRFSPDVVAGVTRETLASTYRLAGYYRLDSMNPDVRPLGFGNSFNSLFFGRDDGEYFQAAGAELTRRAAPSGSEHVTWRLFAERQTAVSKGTNWSIPRLFSSGSLFDPNLTAQRADEAGAELGWRFGRGVSASSLRWETQLTADGAAGTFDYWRPSATVTVGFPLTHRYVASVEGAAGTSFGDVPLQRNWFLGGPASLRGYSGAAAYGQSFWRGRAEVATSFPAARLAIFSDAGWAGRRSDWRAGRPLYSAGIGASLLDGYVRLDLARALRRPTGWRLDLYLDGIL